MKKSTKGQSDRKRRGSSLLTTDHVAKDRPRLDGTDTRILDALQHDCRTPLETIARKLGVPKSTVHYRIRRLEQAGVIEHYFAKVNAAKVGKDYLVVVLVRAKYGPRYHERIGRRIAAIPGVWAIYYVLGETDFVALIRANDREDYMNKLDKMLSMRDIERTNTQVVIKMIKEDPRIKLA